MTSRVTMSNPQYKASGRFEDVSYLIAEQNMLTAVFVAGLNLAIDKLHRIGGEK